ncbi:MAG: hypothetical protein P4L41_17845 [Flavipsychrobacter sp.]|nr:hypothetical protein [Flavipsychrobacter sp.]
MKAVIIVILLLISTPLYGQPDKTLFQPNNRGLLDWTYNDFVKNNITGFEAYSMDTANSIITSRKSLRQKLEVDTIQHTLTGYRGNYSTWVWSPLLSISTVKGYYFRNWYNSNGDIVLEVKCSLPLQYLNENKQPNKEANFLRIDSIRYFYTDTLLLKKLEKFYFRTLIAYKKIIDTAYLDDIFTTEDLYTYNEKKLQSVHYKNNDSVLSHKWNLTIDTFYSPNNKWNFYRRSYIYEKKKYDHNFKIAESAKYTDSGKIDKIEKFSYDSSNRLSGKIAESSFLGKRAWDSILYKYDDTTLAELYTFSSYSPGKYRENWQKYNGTGLLLNSFTRSIEGWEANIAYSYEYDTYGRISSKTYNGANNDINKCFYQYNDKGYLKSYTHTLNDRTIQYFEYNYYY